MINGGFRERRFGKGEQNQALFLSFGVFLWFPFLLFLFLEALGAAMIPLFYVHTFSVRFRSNDFTFRMNMLFSILVYTPSSKVLRERLLEKLRDQVLSRRVPTGKFCYL